MRACDDFFEKIGLSAEALTFGDVRLKTNHSDVLPSEVSLETKFSRRVSLKIPIVSAAMDTVTERNMAIAMAMLGGLGIIHRNLTIDQQREEVRAVKHKLSGLIERPVTVRDTDSVKMVLKKRQDQDLSFHSFPVLNSDKKLVGVITQTDFDVCADIEQPVSTIMTGGRLITASPKATIDEAYQKMIQTKKRTLPLVDKHRVLRGMYLFSDIIRIKSDAAKMHNVDNKGRLRVGAAVGVGREAFERAEAIAKYVDVIVIDTAHGDTKSVFDTLESMKRSFPDIDIVAGNVSEGDSAARLALHGADGIKIGQGPGSICTTRIIAGVGCPQVSAVYNSAEALKDTGVPICADGGIENSGDITVAIGAGAHCVMLGKLLAGTEEAPGTVDRQFTTYPVKRYRGMGSPAAMAESQSSRERYRQGGAAPGKTIAEGVEAVVPYVGNLATVMEQYLGGLRAGMAYVGARTIGELRDKADFHRITSAGIKESHPHGVEVTHDAPNYSRRRND